MHYQKPHPQSKSIPMASRGRGLSLGRRGVVPSGRVHKGKQSTHTAKNIRVTYELMYTFKHNANAKPKSKTWVMVVPPNLFSKVGGVKSFALFAEARKHSMTQHQGSNWCVAMLLWCVNLCANAMVGTQASTCMHSAWLLHVLSMGRESNAIKQWASILFGTLVFKGGGA